jgi:hypothetical protein
VTEESDVKWVRAMVTPRPLKTLEEPLHLSDHDTVSRFPRTHIRCTRRGGLLFSFIRRLIFRLISPRPMKEPGWRLRQLPTGHDAMITMPRELAGLLLEVADTVRL